MKRICYTQHLKNRMRLREIPDHLPEEIYEFAEERYYDNEMEYGIAIKRIDFKGRQREMIVVYEETDDEINLVTVHPIKPNEKRNRLRSKRWRKYESN